MKGIPLLKKEGAIKNSLIKLNYIFTTSENLIIKKLFHISKDKKIEVYKEFMKRLSILV
jgi:mRNA interferase MazF